MTTGDQPPGKPPERVTDPDQQTIVSNLGGDPPQIPSTTQVTGIPVKQSPSDVQDGLMTRVSVGGRRPGSDPGTQVTNLNVEAGSGVKVPDPGTHHNQIWGDFSIGKLLGKGGMGAVYKGRQISLDREVAIKVLPAHLSNNEDFRARFQVEARAVAKINSPHVIQVYAAGMHDGHHYFAMEFVEGLDVSGRLKKGWKPKYLEVLGLISQAVRGLVAAGEFGIIHRDIKPANMMLTAKGVLKLMDFGLAKLTSAETGLTLAGTIMGTVNYFSPEQGRGETCDCRTDIYAMGVVFYELITGRLPFTGQDATSIIYQHIHQEPRKPKEIDPGIPENYQAVVLKCLQKKPEHRYQTAQDLLDDLTAIREGRVPTSAFMDPASMRTGGTVVRTPPFTGERTSRVLPILLSLLVLAIGGAAGWWFVLGPGQDGTMPWQAWAAKPTPPAEVVPPPVVTQPLVVEAPVDPKPAMVIQTIEVPVQVPVPTGDPEALAIQVASLLTDGHWAEARRAAEQARTAVPGDVRWAGFIAAADRGQAGAFLTRARAAMGEQNLSAASNALAEARALTPDDPAIAEIQTAIDAQEGSLRVREQVLTEARNAMAAGEAARAEELLTALSTKLPDDPEVAREFRAARRQLEEARSRAQAAAEQVEAGKRALERNDLDAAQLAFTAAMQHDTASAAASAGLAEVSRKKEDIAKARTRFTAALKAKELAEAEAALADLRIIAPGSAALVLAEAELTNSKLAEQEAARVRQEREARMSGQARAVMVVIQDPKSDIPAMEASLTRFLESAGADRPERPELEAAIEDRRQELAVGTMLERFDAAVLTGDPALIAGLVTDRDLVDRLAKLKTYGGLVFQSSLRGLARTGETAVAMLSVRHALRVFPESLLSLECHLAHRDGTWIIESASVEKP